MDTPWTSDDFFATRSKVIFVLHPCTFSPLGFLSGFNSITKSLSFDASQGTILVVVPKAGGEPAFFEVPGSFMWHALKAYEAGSEIIADFVGYDDPDHFIGDNPPFRQIMSGRMGNKESPGTIRRYVLNTSTSKTREGILDTDNHEFLMTNPRVQLGEHKVGYYAVGGIGGVNSSLKRMDMRTGRTQVFNFDTDTAQVGELVFVPHDEKAGPIDDGWLIAQCPDAGSERTFLGVFDANAVDAGPLAKVWLTHHVPISFHGGWTA